MHGIEFNEDNEFHIKSRKYLGYRDGTMMERFLIDKKIVKNEKQAQYLLLGVSVFLFISAFFVAKYVLVSEKIDYVVSPEGEKIETEEYIKMLGRGENPLN